MERLTCRMDHGIIMQTGYDFSIDPDDYDLVQKILGRLAAYEDTGLEPEKVNQIRKATENMMFENVGDFVRYAISNFEDLEKYRKAEQEGRLVVLPCKVGDTVWLLKQKCKHAGEQNKPWDSCNQYWSNVYRKGMWGCAGKDSEGNTFPCEKKEMVWYAQEMEYSLTLYAPHVVLGKNLFLTREEAEAALAGKGGESDA